MSIVVLGVELGMTAASSVECGAPRIVGTPDCAKCSPKLGKIGKLIEQTNNKRQLLEKY